MAFCYQFVNLHVRSKSDVHPLFVMLVQGDVDADLYVGQCVCLIGFCSDER